MDNDDRQVGRVLSRREALALLGAAAASVLVGCGPGASSSAPPTSAAGQATASGAAAPSLNPEAATSVATATANPGLNATAEAATSSPAEAAAGSTPLPTCIVRPEQTEGPYYADVQLNRSDIRSDPTDGSVKAGVPLQLTMRVSQIGASGCTPLQGAIVEIWHCDAQGAYSAFAGEGTAGQKFLRGYQVTDAHGLAQFTTIYPGWYRGRTIHIHFQVRSDGTSGQSYEFTSQLYFDDAISDQVLAQAPYSGNRGQRDTTNARDGLYRGGGDQLMLTLSQADEGYTATFDIGLDVSGSST